MTDPDEQAVVICMPADHPPTVPSVQIACYDCGYPVWISEQMKANILDDPNRNAVARCLTCARKAVLFREGPAQLAPVPDWQRDELPGFDFEAAGKLAQRWLNE